jgi:hypothetical protein
MCVFPELGLTGFHRKVASQATPAGMEAALGAI